MALAFAGLGDRDTTMRGDDRRRSRAELGPVPARALNPTRRRRKTSSMPTRRATSASSARASCRCASPATGWRRATAPRARPTGSASSLSSNCRRSHNPPAGFLFNANNANVAPDHVPIFGRDWEETLSRAPHPAILRHDRQATRSIPQRRCRRTTSRSRRSTSCRCSSVPPDDDRAQAGAGLLATWDGMMDKDRPSR